MSKRKKILLGVGLALVVVVIALGVIVPMLVDVDHFRPRVVSLLEDQTGKPARIGHLALRILPSVAVQVDDISLGNPAGFPSGDFLAVKRITVVVDGSALLHRQVVIKSLQLKQPAIHLISRPDGRWNYESQPKAAAKPATTPEEKPLFTLGTISDVTLSDGQMTVAEASSSGKTAPPYTEAKGVAAHLQQVDLNALTARLVPRPRPEGPTLAEILPFWSATPAYAAPSEPTVAQGTLQVGNLRFEELQATAVKANVTLYPKHVRVDNLNFKTCSGQVSGNLTLNFGGSHLQYSTNANLHGIDVAQLLQPFPDLRGKMTGKLEGTAKITGEGTNSNEPLAGMSGDGNAVITDGEMPSLQINKNLMMLARFSNLGPAAGSPSSFSKLAADFKIANQQITSSKIKLNGNGADVDGSGVVSLAGEGNLNYSGTASLQAGQNGVTNLLAGLSGAKYENGKLVFPFTVSGPLANPHFSLINAKGILQGLLAGQQQGTNAQSGQPAQSPANLVQGLGNLFKKKKTDTAK
jgi:uncharacterized protein involved in outer membrane biogenesis